MVVKDVQKQQQKTPSEEQPPAKKRPDDGAAAGKEKSKDQQEKEEKAAAAAAELTEEEKKLQDDLRMLVERLGDADISLHIPALESMRSLIRTSTTSMTSVPKPLKFMRPHYGKMKEIFAAMAEGEAKKRCADIISVLAMCSDERHDCITYRLLGANEPIGDWGHEYVRHLSMEMSAEWMALPAEAIDDAAEQRRAELLQLIKQIISHNFAHNAEVEACDLLIELELLPLLKDHVSEADHERVCLYLLSCSPLTPNPDNHLLIQQARDLYLKFNSRFEALRCAVMLNDIDGIKEIFLGSGADPRLQKQMAILLGRHQVFLELEDERLAELNSNVHLHEYFRWLARELDIMEPKTPEGIYKTHLEHGRPFATQQTDVKRQDLAASFVNGFVNCGFGVDKMLGDSDNAAKWFAKNKDYACMSAAASLGLIHRWDIDNGLAQCDPFLSSDDDFVRAGTLLAIGIISCGIQDPVDPACAILTDHVHSDRVANRLGSILGLGLAYANSKRETVWKEEDGGVIYELRKVFGDQKASANAEVKGLAGLSMGLILVGTGDHDAASELLAYLMESAENSPGGLRDANHRFVALGIALIFLGTQERSEVFLESVRVLPEPFGSMTATLIDVCAYAGTGNVEKIQQMLHICSEQQPGTEGKEPEVPGSKSPARSVISNTTSTQVTTGGDVGDGASAVGEVNLTAPQQAKNSAGDSASTAPLKGSSIDHAPMQAVAVLGTALIAMGEEIGSQMLLRMLGHMMRYGDPSVRRSVPLALGLLSVSNPQLTILETLSKYARDSDAGTAHNAIFAMGLVGAGTNNARLVAMLRLLASYHVKDAVAMMLIRTAQGLTHLGKGTMTLTPFHSDRQLMCPAAVAGLFATCFAFIDGEKTVLNTRQHYLLYTLVVAIQPRMLITLAEEGEEEAGAEGTSTGSSDGSKKLKQINVQVRVGQAVDVVAQAGKPKTITGFQTHSTPVLLAYGERAELASEEWLSLTPHLEGLVILRKNPDWEGASGATGGAGKSKGDKAASGAKGKK